MRFYKLLANAYSCKNPLLLKIDANKNGFNDHSIYEDVDLNCSCINAELNCKGNDVTIEDYISSNIGIPVVTEKAKEVIEKLSIGSTVFIPVNVSDFPDLSTKLYAMHIRNHVDDSAIDLSISKCAWETIAVYGFHEEQIKGNDMFRLKKNYYGIFVSQNFVQAVRKNKLTGMVFGTVRTSK